MERLGTYEITRDFSNENAGFCAWGFGKKNGTEYFIKQFVDPKYPQDDTVSSPERVARRCRECEEFERKKRELYQRLDEYSDGNVVRIQEFFRIGSKYYMSMERMDAICWGVEDIAALPAPQIRHLCAIIAHGIAGIHRGGIVHADLKHDNILFTRTTTGYVTAKIIDFDSSFLESEPPEAGDEIVGDLVYFSPEACLSIWGEEMTLSCKMDVFALGVLFHQYFTGELPDFDTGRCSYPGEAVANGLELTVSQQLPPDLRQIIGSMLEPEPSRRPTAMEVFCRLRGIPVPDPHKEPPDEEAPADASGAVAFQGSFFRRAGDL